MEQETATVSMGALDSNPFGSGRDLDSVAPSVEYAATKDFDAEDGYGTVHLKAQDERNEDVRAAEKENLLSGESPSSSAPSTSAFGTLQALIKEQFFSAGSQRQNTEDDLERKEKQLHEREAKLEERESTLNKSSAKLNKPNWPLPSFHPIAYHDIVADVPVRYQPLVQKSYLCVLWTWVCLLLNWVVVLTVVVDGVPDANSSSDAFWATLYVLIGIPGSWKLWYRAVYWAPSGRAKWLRFFATFAVHIGFVLLVACGVFWASGGLFTIFGMINQGFHAGLLLGVACTLAWFVNLAFSVYLLKQAHMMWKTGGRVGGDLATQSTEAVASVVTNVATNVV